MPPTEGIVALVSRRMKAQRALACIAIERVTGVRKTVLGTHFKTTVGAGPRACSYNFSFQGSEMSS